MGRGGREAQTPRGRGVWKSLSHPPISKRAVVPRDVWRQRRLGTLGGECTTWDGANHRTRSRLTARFLQGRGRDDAMTRRKIPALTAAILVAAACSSPAAPAS